jgi:hypothetical protein
MFYLGLPQSYTFESGTALGLAGLYRREYVLRFANSSLL